MTESAGTSPKRKRVAYLIPIFSRDESDWCIPVQHHLVRRLAEQVDIEVFPLRYPLSKTPYSFYSAKVFPQGAGLVRGWRRLPLLHRTLRLLERQHEVKPFDLVEAMWADEPGYLATRFAEKVGIPSIVSVQGGELVQFDDIEYGGMRGLLGPRLIPRALARATRVVVGSRYQDALAEGFAPAERRTILPLGIDSELFSTRTTDESGPSSTATLPGSPALLFVASLVPVKQPLLLLDILSLVREQLPEAHLHVVGEGYLHGRMIEESRARELSTHLTFHGSQAHDALPAFYAGADLTLLCSRHEGQALCVLESGAMGTPVIGSAKGILPDIPECIALENPQAHMFAEEVVGLWRDDDRRGQLGQDLAERIHREYTIDQTVERRLELYAELTASAPGDSASAARASTRAKSVDEDANPKNPSAKL